MSREVISLAEARAKSSDFIYLFASDKFLKAIGSKYGRIIYAKRANQVNVAYYSADKSGVSHEAYIAGIREQFTADYGMDPQEALIKLAQGEQVAGKNWAAGIFGIGATKKTTSFLQADGGAVVSVDPKTGAILRDGAATGSTVYALTRGSKGNAVPSGYSYTDAAGNQYLSEYNPRTKTYYAAAYQTAGGDKQNADGGEWGASDSGSIWANVILALSSLADDIIAIFGDKEDKANAADPITYENTFPAQQADGWTFDTASALPIALLGGGALLLGAGVLPKFWKKAQDSKKKSK